MSRAARWLCAAIAAGIFLTGYTMGYHDVQQAHRAPAVCIVVNPDGNPAPASCSDPDAYQVSP